MNQRKNKPVVGISIGDINGIGVEVTIKALLDNRLTKLVTPVIYAHGKALTFYRKHLGIEDFNFMQIKNIEEVHHKKVNVINVLEESPEVIPGVETQEAGKLALAALDYAIKDLKGEQNRGFGDCSSEQKQHQHIRKEICRPHRIPYRSIWKQGQPDVYGCRRFRVGLVTGHLPLKDVAKNVTAERIKSKLNIMIKSLNDDFGITKPKIAILGLNPHAGEDGLLGEEEENIIKPLVKEYKDKGHLIFGPFAADGFFGMRHQKKFDGVLAMYHDQGLIPFKSEAFENGVNYTAGLPIIRTSPDHGTAYNIAGKNMADEGSMRAAIMQAYDIIRHKGNWEEEGEA
jgi:4-hydroxythreonine-4-phosphate dehydrogenase